MGIIGLVIGALLFRLLPEQHAAGSSRRLAAGAGRAFGLVFRNPQSILCGVIAGLLFIPTTIFDMIWGVRYLQDAHGFEYGAAVMRSATVPLGWIIGCPLLGAALRRIGRRKPVIIGGAVGPARLPGVDSVRSGERVSVRTWSDSSPESRSGAAMLPYTVIKEANPPEMSGTATGVVNFLNFTFSALLGPVFGGVLLTVQRRRAPDGSSTTRRRSSRCCTASDSRSC